MNPSKRTTIFFLVFVFVVNKCAHAVVNIPATRGRRLLSPDEVPLRLYPPVNVDKAADDDTKQEQRGEPPRFAIPNADFVTPQTHGLWESPKPGIQVWRLRVKSPSAKSMNLGFTKFNMPPGGQLQLYDQKQQPIFRPFTADDNKPHQQLWTPPVLDDTVMIEVVVPEESKDLLELELTSVNVGYRGFGETTSQKGLRTLSGTCNVDVECTVADDWEDQIRTAAVFSYGGSRVCSGGMINQAVSSAKVKPLFLTANHCKVTASNAPSMVIFWNYQTSACNEKPNGVLSDFQTGATFRANYEASDFALVELDDMPNPTWSVGWAGWDRTDAATDSAVAIHHPAGDEKRISFEYNPTSITSYYGTSSPGDGSHIRVTDWDLGTTEPGSSGSHLFNQARRVVGQLHGGDAACGNDLSDWYGRLARSWTGGGTSATRLSDWLDPDNTLVMTTDTLILNPAVGACCKGLTCAVEKKSDCILASGTYLGDASSCINRPNGNPRTISSGTINIAIPDNGGPTNAVTHTITVTESFLVGDVNVLITIDHTYIGDLIILLSHSGVTANLMTRRSTCGSDNMNVVLDDDGSGGRIQDICISNLVSPPNYRPVGTLSVFDGIDASGQWTIKVYDSASTDIGTLVRWGIQIDEVGTISPCEPLPPTPAPTQPKVTPSQTPSLAKSPFCFSNENTVDVRGSGSIPLESLKIGDFVRSDDNNYSRVYSFAHRDSSIETEYIRIHVAEVETPLEISPDHFLYIEGKSARASQVIIGDHLDQRQVTNVEHIKRRGAYAPLTESGSIVVSGVRCSNYVSILDHISPSTQNAAMHYLSSYRRLTCSMNFEACQRETYTMGIADWLCPFCGLSSLLSNFASRYQLFSIALVAPLAILMYTVEQVSSCPLVFAFGILLVYVHQKRGSFSLRFLSYKRS